MRSTKIWLAGIMCTVGTISLSGCGPLIVGGAAAKGASVASQDRTVGNAVDDTRISLQISDLWFRHSEPMFNALDLTVNEGKVLITGQVQNPDWRVDAVRLAWQVQGVREVINEIEITRSGGIAGYARDSRIIAELRTKILFDGKIKSVNYTLDAVGGVVYLMGVAQNQQELDRVVDHARNISSVRKVISYVRMRDQDPAMAAGAPPSSVASPGSGSATSGSTGTRLPDGSISTSPSFDPRAQTGDPLYNQQPAATWDGPNDSPVQTETLDPVQ